MSIFKDKLKFTLCTIVILTIPLTQVNAQSVNITNSKPNKQAIYVIEDSLPDVLRQAATRNGFEITMTSRVRGTLQKITLPLNMEKMLEKIAPQFDLKWHFQDNQLYVSVGSENTTRMIFLGKTKIKDLEKVLETAQFKAQGASFTYIEDSNSVIVNGPVSYVASVELLAESLTKNKAAKREKLKIIRFGNMSNQ